MKKKMYIILLYYNIYIGILILFNWFFLLYEDIMILEIMFDYWLFKEEKMCVW